MPNSERLLLKTRADDLAAHVYDVTYGVIKPTDNLWIIDDSIVRGTNIKK
jgi:amidophosphoribosyltransferase